MDHVAYIFKENKKKASSAFVEFGGCPKPPVAPKKDKKKKWNTGGDLLGGGGFEKEEEENGVGKKARANYLATISARFNPDMLIGSACEEDEPGKAGALGLSIMRSQNLKPKTK